jgi:hypothetical protein
MCTAARWGCRLVTSFVNLATLRKPARKRRKPAAQVTEKPTQRKILAWLHQVLPLGSLVSATMNESMPKSKDPGQMARYFQQRKASGVVTGWPDLSIVLPGGRIVFLEAKRPVGGVLSAAQQDVHAQLRALGHHVGVASSIETARHVLREAGVPLRESAAEQAEVAHVRLAKPRVALLDDGLPF